MIGHPRVVEEPMKQQIGRLGPLLVRVGEARTRCRGIRGPPHEEGPSGDTSAVPRSMPIRRELWQRDFVSGQTLLVDGG
jgi:hypothetical protein